MSNPSYTNKLINEKSPYLLSYAHTPVNWFPWGEEAFKEASELNKPIFLSIGHATSRLCKVMLEETFGDPETAAFMNEQFINVKVDKEEYPHLATLYLEFATMLSSDEEGMATSWPLNIFLTPDLVPFFSVSNFIMEDRFCKGSLKQVLNRIHEIWTHPEEREILLDESDRLFQVISFVESCVSKDRFDLDDINRAVSLTYAEADSMYGGLRSFPKVPGGQHGRFLLRFAKEHNDSRALFYVDRTLDMMRLGGVHDHLGGGFYRYVIDDKWLIPCFEKTLMDNAVIALLYLETWAFTGKELYKEVGIETLKYLSDNLLDPQEGCYFLSEDGGPLGAKNSSVYSWSRDEIYELLAERSDIFCEYYGICRDGLVNGRNVLHVPLTVDMKLIAEKYRCSEQEVFNLIKDCRGLLLEKRKLRAQSFIDDQAVSYCNGFMVYTLVQAGLLLGDVSYFDQAKRTAEFIRKYLIKDGTLLRRWRDGESGINAYLEDYACVILGYLSLFEVGEGIHWLEEAVALVKVVMSRFKNDSGLFYSTEINDDGMIVKCREVADRDGISGNGLFAECLLILYAITGKREFLKECEEMFYSSKSFFEAHPLSCFSQLSAFQRYCSQDKTAVHICLKDNRDREKILEGFYRNYLPNKSLIWFFPEDNQDTSILDGNDIHKMLAVGSDKTTIFWSDNSKCIKFCDVQEFVDFMKSTETS